MTISASQIERTFGLIIELIDLLKEPSLVFTPNRHASAQTSGVRTPDGITAAVSSPSVRAPWDPLAIQFGDSLIMNLESQEEGSDKGRKRRRTTDTDFALSGTSLETFMPGDWNPALDLDTQDFLINPVEFEI